MSAIDPYMINLGPRAIAGISGGRTSGRMAYMVDAVLCFQNTGEEHEKTLDFLRRIEDDIGRPIYRLEWRSPTRGDPPRMASFEIVDHENLQRRGEPFRDMLECLKAYRRKHKGRGPIAPWVKSRICTAYLKVRTQRRFCEWLGWSSPKEYTEYVGFRADEPSRVAKMRGRNAERHTDERAPMFDLGMTRDDVLKCFRCHVWSRSTGSTNRACRCVASSTSANRYVFR